MTVRCPRNLLAAVVVLLVAWPGLVYASERTDDFAARRARVMERLGPDAMLILWSAPARNYSRDVDYEYRQDSNLYYLTGITQEDTILVLMPGNNSRREILFIRERNLAREHWNGRSLSSEETTGLSGIRTVLGTREFEPFVAAMLSRRGSASIDEHEAAAFFGALAAGRAKVALIVQADTLDQPPTRPMDFSRRIRERFAGFQTIDATPIFDDLRVVKTPYEQAMLVKSLEISSEALLAGMRATHPGAFEYEVKAAVEAVHRGRGAVSSAYPSIVGSGPNATILHYPEGNRQMAAGELLLVDAGANYEYMASDVTRTFPVSGTFSPAQKDLYKVVLDAQEEAVKVAAKGGSLTAMHNATVEAIKQGLLKLGLITDVKGDQYKMWYTHSAGHYVGIDVHDPGDRGRPLQHGMAFTIEPGIYVRQSALEALPQTAENAALIEKIRPAVARYADIGVRIEDSFLVEESGLRNLSAAVPRTIDEIEAFMRKR